MADIFHRDNVRKLIDGKYILFFGDSNVRALYKDVLTIYQKNQLITEASLRKKLEKSFAGDSLLHSIGLTRGRDFKEHRCFTKYETIIEFFFVTKCLCPDVTDTLDEISRGKSRVPDVIVMNSTLWDVTRWGADSVSLFKDNLRKLVNLFKTSLPESTLIIWLTTPPLAKVRGGFVIPAVEFVAHTVRFEAMEANRFAEDTFGSSGYDVLDFHYYLLMNVHRRNTDGIHWQSRAVRYMTNLLLTHISVSWEKDLPGNLSSLQLEKLNENLEKALEEASTEATLPSILPSQPSTQERPRIKARDRLGDSVVSSRRSSPQEDLRTRLHDLKNFKNNTKNNNCSQLYRNVHSRHPSQQSIGIPQNSMYYDNEYRSQQNSRRNRRGNRNYYTWNKKTNNMRYLPY